MSSLGCQLDSQKSLMIQILPSGKKSLDRISALSPLVIVVCPVTMFCISWVAMYAANDVAENLICSWNHHRILGPQGCVPAETCSYQLLN